jgi:hypothetical protein
MNRILKVALVVAVAAAIVGGVVWSFLAHRGELAEEAASDKPIGNPARVTRDASGGVVVKFDRELQQRMEIRVETLPAVTRRPEITAYGRLEEDPSRSFILRAPVAGSIRAAAGVPWPNTGDVLVDRFVAGQIEPRLPPTDRITLSDRLATAKAEVESSTAALATARAALYRARTLNADDKNVSDRVMQEAEARVAAEQARLTAAGQSVDLIRSGLAPARDAALPLELERGGQVVEVLAHPGESIESGQPILRVARLDQLIARVDAPAGEPVAAATSGARIVPLGWRGGPVRGERVAIAAAIDPKTQGQPFLFRILDPSLSLRPGLSVTAYLESPGASRRGVIVPQAAVVRQSGQTWVYVQIAEGQFARREVALEEPVAEGWFTRSLPAGSPVVSIGAQTLLSEEFKSQIQVGEESQQ